MKVDPVWLIQTTIKKSSKTYNNLNQLLQAIEEFKTMETGEQDNGHLID